jgi:hypothetical protein
LTLPPVPPSSRRTGDAAVASERSPSAGRASRDNRLAASAIFLGASVALAGFRTPGVLAIGGVTVAAGVLLTVRRARPIAAPTLLALALAATTLATVAAAVVSVYEEWQLGSHFADGTAPTDLRALAVLLAPYERAVAALRALATFAAGSLLLGAAVTRFSGK